MNYRSNVAAIACLSVIGMGITGCGGSSHKKPVAADPVPEEEVVVVVPDYAKPVAIDVNTSKKAAGAIMWSRGLSRSMSETAEKDSFAISKRVNSMTPSGVGLDEDEELDMSFDITVPCAYGGSYQLTVEHTYMDGGDVEQWEGTKKITFNDCVHDEALIMSGFSENNDGYKYAHSGSKQKVYSSMDINGGVDTEKEDVIFDNISIVATDSAGEKVAMLAVSMTESYEDYDSESVFRETDIMNGTIAVEFGYDENGTALKARTEEAIAFETKNDRVDGVETTVINGYKGTTRAGVDVQNQDKIGTMYVYGENFTSVKQGMQAPGGDGNKHETFTGVLGTSCMGGTVTYATPVTWDTNSSISEISPVITTADSSYRTPFVGTTTIAGLNSNATVNFAMNEDNKSYGTITVGDGEPSEPATRHDMQEEYKNLCFPWAND